MCCLLLRDRRMNVYANPQRVHFPTEATAM
jgi:hypothetical protein